MSLSKVRQNFHSNSEAVINKQINMEMYASYVYLAMYAYFNRDDVALHGFAKMFKKNSEEERYIVVRCLLRVQKGKLVYLNFDLGNSSKTCY